MNASKLRHQVTIMEIVNAQDADTGIVTPSRQVFADEIWAAIEPVSVREFIAAGGEKSKVTTRITIRYLDGIKPSMEIDHGTRTYKLEGPPLSDAKSGIDYLTLPCSEIVSG